MADDLGGQRQDDTEGRAAARGRLYGDRAAVRGDQRGHDGQPEAGAAGLPGPGLVRAVEALEDPIGLLRGQPRAVVGHLHLDRRPPAGGARHPGAGGARLALRRGRSGTLPVRGARPYSHLDGRAVRGVDQRVAHQVADDLTQPYVVAEHDGSGTGLDGQVDAALRGHHPGVVHRVGGQREQVHRPAVQRALLVQPGQQQQVLDQHAHPGSFLLQPPHDPVQVGPGDAAGAVLQAAALPVQLGEAADRGQRGAQLVAGVGDELPHPHLGPAGRRLGVGPVAERALHLGEHRVQRPAEPADLGPLVPLRHPAGQVAGRDVLRRLLDLDQRPQAAADQGHADDGQDRQHDQADDQVDADQVPDRAVHAGHVDRRDDDPGQRAVRGVKRVLE